jgi:hypothetical protein
MEMIVYGKIRLGDSILVRTGRIQCTCYMKFKSTSTEFMKAAHCIRNLYVIENTETKICNVTLETVSIMVLCTFAWVLFARIWKESLKERRPWVRR